MKQTFWLQIGCSLIFCQIEHYMFPNFLRLSMAITNQTRQLQEKGCSGFESQVMDAASTLFLVC